jgi:indole-3-glycerol phosphate synthase
VADRPFSSAILEAKERGLVPLVADIKPVSPLHGDLVRRRNPAELAGDLVKAGACALSVVTESKNFGGSLQMLGQVAGAVAVPVLRKDFLTYPGQLDETREEGAAAVLMTLATVPNYQASQLYRRALELGLEVVVEVHTDKELEFALELEPTIIGINNRDILQLEKDDGDVGTTEALAPLVPEGVVTLSESALRTAGDIRRALAAGADAVLVGTAILEADDPISRVAALTGREER